jgi:capsular polysaccharide transport system permease protein
MNERAQSDAMNVAEANVTRSQRNVLDSQAKLTAFRNRELLVDPSSQSLQVIELIGKLSAELSLTSAQIDQTRASTPSGPVIQSLMAKAASLQTQVNVEQAKIAGNKEAMASKISEFEQLTMTREFADRQLQSAASTLETAIQDARRQQIYIETVVSPNLADQSTEPRRFRLIVTVLVFSFILFAMVWILYVGAREHAHA